MLTTQPCCQQAFECELCATTLQMSCTAVKQHCETKRHKEALRQDDARRKQRTLQPSLDLTDLKQEHLKKVMQFHAL